MHAPAASLTLAERVASLAAGWRAAASSETFPRDRIDQLREAGALAAFAAIAPGEETSALAAVLRLIGGADLSVGRLYEGHVNAAQLVTAYGAPGQRESLDRDLAAGRLMGVWNTEPSPGMRLTRDGEGRRLHGAKVFATGAGELDRVLVTARDEAGIKRMILVDVAGMRERADNDGWRVRGMKGTLSGRFDFDGMIVPDAAVIGGPGDYEREPRFSAGAWRFTAVQQGATEALVRLLRDHLIATGKHGDAIQRVRFGACVAAARSAGLWVDRAAQLAEHAAPDAVPMVLMTRGIVEDAALAVMEAAARAVGTASFFDGDPIDRLTRDLGLYLRQPVPDQARERAAASWLEADRWGEDPWW